MELFPWFTNEIFERKITFSFTQILFLIFSHQKHKYHNNSNLCTPVNLQVWNDHYFPFPTIFKAFTWYFKKPAKLLSTEMCMDEEHFFYKTQQCKHFQHRQVHFALTFQQGIPPSVVQLIFFFFFLIFFKSNDRHGVIIPGTTKSNIHFKCDNSWGPVEFNLHCLEMQTVQFFSEKTFYLPIPSTLSFPATHSKHTETLTTIQVGPAKSEQTIPSIFSCSGEFRIKHDRKVGRFHTLWFFRISRKFGWCVFGLNGTHL